MKPDVEGEFVASIIERQPDTPRSLPKGSMRKLYFSSPNSRFGVFAALFFAVLDGMIFYLEPHPDPYPSSTMFGKILGAVLILVMLAGLLVVARRLKYALECGVSTVGKVEALLYQEKGSPSTYAGMSNGAIRPTISYSVNGVQHTAQRFLDRPWVRDVQPGTELHLLVDPENSKLLYVVGIAAQPAQPPEATPPKHLWARRS